MTEVHTIMSSIDRLNSRKLFPIAVVNKTRGHRFRIRRKRFRGGKIGTFSARGVVRAWNALSERVVENWTLAEFKKLTIGSLRQKWL